MEEELPETDEAESAGKDAPSPDPTGDDDLSDLIGEGAPPKSNGFAGSELVAVLDVKASLPEGSHIAGGGDCPGNYVAIGSFADCGGGTCNGNQKVCVLTAKVAKVPVDGSILTALTISAENAHVVDGTPCAAGFEQFLTLADCGQGSCLGNQIFCKQLTSVGSLKSTTSVVTAISITPENTHQAGGTACNDGFAVVGTAADCGLGSCIGSQTICAKAEKP